jgi:hypothetical protein
MAVKNPIAATLCFEKIAMRVVPAADTTSASYTPLTGSEQETAPARSPAWSVTITLVPAATPLDGAFTVIEEFVVLERGRSPIVLTKLAAPSAFEARRRRAAAAPPAFRRKVAADRMVPI